MAYGFHRGLGFAETTAPALAAGVTFTDTELMIRWSDPSDLVGRCPSCGRPASHRSGLIFDCACCGLIENEPEILLSLDCRNCRYYLAGLAAYRCPECGTPTSLGQLQQFGLLPPERFCDRMALLQQRFLRSKAGADVAELPQAERGLRRSEITDELAHRLLPKLAVADELYAILRRSGSSAGDGLVTVYGAIVHLDGDAMTDTAALAMLPPSQTCRELYHHLRKLGYEWARALALILPHAKSYEPGWS